MGVKTCNKNRCGGIMCDVHISEIGYICYDCTQEFKKWLEIKGFDKPMSEEDYLNKLKTFMSIRKSIDGESLINVDQFFDAHK